MTKPGQLSGRKGLVAADPRSGGGEAEQQRQSGGGGVAVTEVVELWRQAEAGQRKRNGTSSGATALGGG